MEISNKDFKKLIYQATDMITDWYDKKLRGSKIYNNKSPAEIRETFKIKSKNKGTKAHVVIKKLEKPKGFIARKLSSSIIDPVEKLTNIIEEKSMWQRFGL